MAPIKTATKKAKADESPRTDQDSAWKDILDAYLRAFLRFFFPQIEADIDWSRGYESLDKELAQARPAFRTGKLLADKLFKVWLKNGRQTWLLIHIEVQERGGRVFSRRVFVYNYRLMYAHNVEVISLAVVTGSGGKATGHYETGRWGCAHVFDFPVANISDYAARWEELEASDNIFAVVVMAQLKAIETRGDNDRRYEWKLRLLRDLYRRGRTREEITALFIFMDWVMRLPEPLNERILEEAHELEEGKKMPYVTSFERIGMKRGLEQGLQQAREEQRAFVLQLLTRRVGELSATLQNKLARLSHEQIEALGLALLDFKSKADLMAWLKAQAPKPRRARKQNGR